MSRIFARSIWTKSEMRARASERINDMKLASNANSRKRKQLSVITKNTTAKDPFPTEVERKLNRIVFPMKRAVHRRII